MNKKLLLLSLLIIGANFLTAQTQKQKEKHQFIDSLINIMTIEEKIGQMSLFTSDWDKTGPTLREGYINDIKSGKAGAIFNAYTVAYTRKLQKIAVDETRLHIPLIFGYDVIHGHRTIFPIPLG
ncbi:MAG TPA: glycoside hydrolase family 3 N-terminal domain-containing protein, partial [Saprospiraceae bacterium]|nr:glycoside hydrolase family 3 N-terminal domain-containing protein [Saprospiraceae bacterium]